MVSASFKSRHRTASPDWIVFLIGMGVALSAVLVRISLTCLAVRSGLTERISAQIPATRGQALEVPLFQT